MAQVDQKTDETLRIARWLQDWAQQLERLPATQRDPTGWDALDAMLQPVRQRLDETKKVLDRLDKRTERIVVTATETLELVRELVEAGQQTRAVVERRAVFYGVEALPAYYVPRQHELDRLRRVLMDGEGVALTGMGGVGKTVLARALAHDPACAARYPDGVLWAQLGPDARDEADADAALLEWALALGLEAVRNFPTPEAKVRFLAGHLRDRRLLVVVDDVWHSPPARLLQRVRGPDSGLLVATRSPRVAAALELPTLRLDVLEPEEALALLAAARGRPIAETELPLAEELVRRLGRHPLGVRLAGAQLGLPGRDWSTVLVPLRRQQGAALPAIELDPRDRELSLRVCFDLSYHYLSAEAQRRYRRLGVLAPDAPFEWADVEALWRPDTTDAAYEASVQATLHALLDAALLDPVEDGAERRYRQHLLLREDALARMGEEERAAVLSRHAHIYRGVADQAERAGDYRPITRDYAQMEAVLRRAWRAWQPADDFIGEGLADPREEAAEHLNSLVFDCENGYWDLQGLYADRLRWLPRAAYVARQVGNKRNEGAHLGNLGLAYAGLGEARTAIGYYEQALAIARAIGDRQSEGPWLGNLGQAYAGLGEAARARELWQEALRIFEEIESPHAGTVRRWLAG